MDFKDFILLNEFSDHAGIRIKERLDNGRKSSFKLLGYNVIKMEDYAKAERNIRLAEVIYKGPKTYAVEVLPTFPILVGERESFHIPKNAAEVRQLPDFTGAAYGSVGNMLIAILEPPRIGIDTRPAGELNTSTIKYLRSPEVPGIASSGRGYDTLIRFPQFQQDLQKPQSQDMIKKAVRMGKIAAV